MPAYICDAVSPEVGASEYPDADWPPQKQKSAVLARPKAKARQLLTSRQEAFAVAVAKGDNASDAYCAAYKVGRMTAKTVNEEASRLLANPKVTTRVAQLREPAVKAAQLTAERVIEEQRKLITSSIERVLNPDGTYKPLHEWDSDMLACVSQVNISEKVDSEGKVIERTAKVKFWSKVDALNMAHKHLGMFDKNNRQLQPNLKLQVLIVGGPNSETQDGRAFPSSGQKLGDSTPGC